MKKWLAALMALVMITGCVPGSAASYTVDENFWVRLRTRR